MAFTSKNVEENRQMAARADELVEASGYEPANGYFQNEHINPVIEQMYSEFPAIAPDRVRSQIAKAFIRKYSAWVRGRNS